MNQSHKIKKTSKKLSKKKSKKSKPAKPAKSVKPKKNEYSQKELDLEEAINNNDMPEVKRLIKDNALDTNNTDQLYLLSPCIDGNLKMVKFLVKSGADIHCFYDEALANAVQNGHYEIVKFLIANGANVNDADHEPLLISKKKGFVDIEKLLKKHGAAIENFYLL